MMFSIENNPNFKSLNDASDSIVPEPKSPFPQLIDQVVDGLIGALEARNHDLSSVLNSDIVAFSTLQPYTYDYYYGNPYIVFADVRSEIRPIIRKIEELTRRDIKAAESAPKPSLYSNLDPVSGTKTNIKKAPRLEAVIEVLLVALSMKPKILKVLIMTHDLDIWITSLKWIIEHYAKDWQKYEEQKQTYLYHNFCFKFMEILTEWDRADFAPENISGYVKILTVWLKDE